MDIPYSCTGAPSTCDTLTLTLDERWGWEGRVVGHGEIFDARSLPAIIAGEQEGLATYQVRKANERKLAELITFDALTPQCGVGTALIEGLVSRLRAEGVKVLRPLPRSVPEFPGMRRPSYGT